MHRVSALVIGAFLLVFGGLGMLHRVPLTSSTGEQVLGLSSNGLLAGLSVVVGGVLIVAGVIGGHQASTVSTALGALFVLSGLVNAVVLGTSMNLLAFRISNVVFSFVVGTVLLVTGAYGRFTGHLPLSSPYHRDEADDTAELTEEERAARALDRAAAPELADAERADALHHADPEQLRRLAIVHRYRRIEDRERAWRESAPDRTPPG
jgi:hypothetical protein